MRRNTGRVAAIAMAALASLTLASASLAQAEAAAGELSPEAQAAIGVTWLERLNAFYASGDPADVPPSTDHGLEQLRAYDWRFDAVEAGRARFIESWELVESLPIDAVSSGGETTAIDMRLTFEVAERAEGVEAATGEPSELAVGPQRRVMAASFVRDPSAGEWLLDDVGLPSGGPFTFGILPVAPETPCPGLSQRTRGASPFLKKPWCTAGGDGREVRFGRMSARSEYASEILVTRAGCGWDDAVVLSIGWPPGSPRDMLEPREYVRDPSGEVPGADAYRRDVRPPRDTISTGITNGRATLWTSERLGEDAVLVQVGSRLERWPRLTAGCTGN